MTLAGYVQALNNFENYCLEKEGKPDVTTDLKLLPVEDQLSFLQGWINWNGSLSPRSVKNYFSRVKIYIHYRGIKFYPLDLKELVFERASKEELHGLSVKEINTIFGVLRYKHKVQFMCHLSSLMRIGELVQIRKRHLILDGDNIIVKIPSTIAKFKKGRTTYFSKEASKMLRPLLKQKGNDSLVFGTGEKARFSELNTEQILRRVLNKVGLDMRYEDTNRYKINTHSFRAYGITKISRHDPNFAKKIAGQKGYLDEYDRMNDEEKLELYQKIETDLIIDETKKLKAENSEKDETIKELEERNQEVQELKKSQKEMKNRLDKIDLEEKLLKIFGESQEKLIEAVRKKEDSDKIIDLLEKTNKLEKEYSDVAYE